MVYQVSRSRAACLVVGPDGSRWEDLTHIDHLQARLAALKEELRDGTKIMNEKTPRLESFALDWGRALLPSSVLDTPPDVLVLVPHDYLHGIPLHLVSTSQGLPLGALTGIAFNSSMGQYLQSTYHNFARSTHEPGTPHMTRTFRAAGFNALESGPDRYAALAEELRGLIERIDADVTCDPLPSTDRVAIKLSLGRLPPRSTVCLIAHGYQNPEAHELSGLLLQEQPRYEATRRGIRIRNEEFLFKDVPLYDVCSDLELAREGELLTAAELDVDVLTQAELAILLGCSAGASELIDGDIPRSLAETFVQMGVPSVVAPGWDCAFSTSTEWILRFLRSWIGSSNPKAIAARDATHYLLHSDVGLSLAGALTLRGDWL